MTSILLKANGSSVSAVVDGKITSGMVGVPVSIEYDNQWDGLYKTAVFRVGDFSRDRKNIGTSTTVPWEVLRNSGKVLQIGIEGKDSDGKIVMPTIWASCGTILPGANSSIPGAPNPDYEIPEADGVAIDDSVISPHTTWSSKKISEEIPESQPKDFAYEDYNVPTVYFDGDIAEMTKDNKVDLNYAYGDRSGTCTLKWQGSSSLAYPKKNYTVVFDTAFEAKEGWGAQTKYCLKADWIDFSHCRNVMSAKLWGEVVKSRNGVNSNLSALPNGGAVDGFPCFVVINGVWKGIYNFNIPKDGWMMGMGSGEREAILCAGNHTEGSKLKAEAIVGDNKDFELEYNSDSFTTEEVQASLNTLINACLDSDGTDIDTTIAQYLDINSAIDYFIFSVLIANKDGYSKNYILATYDGTKWFFSAYDMDGTFGLEWDGKSFMRSGFLKKWYESSGFRNIASANKVFELLYKYKKQAIIDRYNELRKLTATVSNVSLIFHNYTTAIPLAAKVAENELWKGRPSTGANNVEQIVEWFDDRVGWIDTEIQQMDDMTNDIHTEGLAYTRVADEYYVCKGIGTALDTEIEIAQYVDDLPVTEIAKDAFKGNTDITSVVMKDGLKTIWQSAFENDTNLTDIEIPDSVESVELSAFNATAITELVLPNPITTIPSYCAYNCKSLTSVKMGNRVTKINQDAFNGCVALEKIRLSNNLTDIGRQAFANCQALQRITLPSALKNVGIKSFTRCFKLSSIVIPENVETIEAEAFFSGRNLSTVTFRGTPTSIGENAFFEMGQNITDKSTIHIYVPWAEGAVAGAPWGATNATIHYNSTT